MTARDRTWTQGCTSGFENAPSPPAPSGTSERRAEVESSTRGMYQLEVVAIEAAIKTLVDAGFSPTLVTWQDYTTFLPRKTLRVGDEDLWECVWEVEGYTMTLKSKWLLDFVA